MLHSFRGKTAMKSFFCVRTAANHTKRTRALVCIVTVLALGSAKADTILDVPEVQQATYVWCWVAVSEMVLRYFDVPNVNPAGVYQCGFIGINAVGTTAQICNADCRFCTVPAGNPGVIKQNLE